MKRREHRIADISFFRMYVHCECGRKLTALTPEDLAEEYQAHRVSCGLPRVQPSRSALRDWQ